MPRQVDHDERRRVLAEALWRITSRDGLEAVSMRDVAAEAGVSSAQHYFASKDELLGFAFTYMVQKTVERVGAAVEAHNAAGWEPGAARSLVGQIAREALWTEEELRGQARVWIAFSARAAVRPELASVLRTAYEELQTGIVLILRYAQSVGEVAPDLAIDAAAAELMSLIDGLSVHCLIGVRTHAEAVDVVTHHTDALFVA